jgi:hypothetical protein
LWLYSHNEATFLNCGNLLRAFSTTLLYESIINTWGNDLRHSNNEKDWIIRSQAPKCDIANIWRRFRDYNEMGLKNLANSNESLRYSPIFVWKYRMSNGVD